jgi:hypothetical protein
MMVDTEVGTSLNHISWLNLKICHKYENVFDVRGSRLVSIQSLDAVGGIRVG